MLNVLIADDENNILLGMQKIIDWNLYDYEVVATARNGEEILDAVKTMPIDLIITDIQMPKMRGLDAIPEALKINPNLNFIILSGYDDFNYALEAINLKVKGYLLKPVDEDKLIELLESIKIEILSKKVYIQQCLYNLLHNTATYSKQEDKEISGLFCDTRYRYMYIISDSDKIAKNKITDKEYEKMYSCISGFLGNSRKYYMVPETEVSIGLVVDEMMLNYYKSDIISYGKMIKQRLSECSGRKYSILIGKRVDGFGELLKSKESADALFKLKFYKGNDILLTYEENKDLQFPKFIIDKSPVSGIKDSVVNGPEENITSAIQNFTAYLRESMPDPESIKIHIYNLMMDMCNELVSVGGEVSQYLYHYSVFKDMSNVSIDILKSFLEDICISIYNDITKLEQKNCGGKIHGMIDYLNKNFREEKLNIKYFSELYFINSSYLGQMFKKKTGMNFNKYLNELRLNEAKRLLRTTDMKIFEISHEVGFKDANYFVVKFVESEKISPTQYRKNCLEG